MTNIGSMEIYNGRGTPSIVVSSAGNTITVQHDPRGLYSGEVQHIHFADDKITVRGTLSQEHDTDIVMTDPRHMSVLVRPASDASKRRPGSSFAMEFASPLTQQQYRAIGLQVASSIIGVPLLP